MVAVVLTILLAVAPVSDAGLAALQAEDLRVATVAWRLQTTNVALCPAIAGRVAGLSVHALSQYPGSLRGQARVQFGLGNHPGIAAVAPSSAAERAGLRAGDAILSIEGVETPAVPSATLDYSPVEAVEAQLEAALIKPPADLRIGRGSEVITLSLGSDAGCKSRVQIIPGGAPNAQADGQYVQISAAMLAFADSDDALATIIGHELAHNIRGHRARLDADKVSRGIFAGLGRNGSKLRATEYEADRLGVWLMARAGYDVDAVVPFWTRLRQKSAGGILSDGTHPGWKERLRRLAQAASEVKAQIAAGRALVPSAQ